MLFWDIKWKDFEDDISGLELSQRTNIALASLENVLIKGIEYFKFSLNKEQKKLIIKSLDILWGKGTQDPDVAEKIKEQLEMDHKPGVYDLMTAILVLLNSFKKLNADDTLDVLSYIYQSVLDREIISQLEKDTLESEIQVKERNNPVCLQVIDDQLRFLEEIKNGKLIERQDVQL